MLLFPDFDEGLRDALRARNRAVPRQHPARESQRARTADRQLHVRQRAAGQALRHSQHARAAISGASPSRKDSPRGGLLGQGSILTLTSYATRTSPVLRGKWVLENLLAAPPPPPPPNVPALKTEGAKPAKTLSMREAMIQHRAESGLRELPCAHGSDRLRDGELRRGRQVARSRCRQRRSTSRACCRTARSSTAWRA